MLSIRIGYSTVGRCRWIKINLFRPKRTILVRFGLLSAKTTLLKKAILTKLFVVTILGHLGPVHLPVVPRRLLILAFLGTLLCKTYGLDVCSSRRSLMLRPRWSEVMLACFMVYASLFALGFLSALLFKGHHILKYHVVLCGWGSSLSDC